MKNAPLLVIALLLTALFTGCGTVSDVQTADGSSEVDLSQYHFATVSFSPAEDDPLLEEACVTFADFIVSQLKQQNVFVEVREENDQQPGLLLITGEVTNYDRGNAALRILIGFGAGSTRFDADVRLVDAHTGELVADLSVDKNSWFLGGTYAGMQTPEDFMESAAKKLAEEIKETYDQFPRTAEPPAPVPPVEQEVPVADTETEPEILRG